MQNNEEKKVTREDIKKKKFFFPQARGPEARDALQGRLGLCCGEEIGGSGGFTVDAGENGRGYIRGVAGRGRQGRIVILGGGGLFMVGMNRVLKWEVGI